MAISKDQPLRPYVQALGDAMDNGDIVSADAVQAFDTVAAMQAATYLEAGMTCHTNGLSTVGDGGAAYYTVGTSGDIALQGGLYAAEVSVSGDNEILLAVASANPSIQPSYDTPTLCISKDGIAFTPIKELPQASRFNSDGKVSYVQEIDKFIIVASYNYEDYVGDVQWTITDDFETFTELKPSLGISAYRNTTYPAAAAGGFAYRRWVAVLSKDTSGNYYVSVSMAVTDTAQSDIYQSGFTRPDMHVFMVPITIDAAGQPSSNGAVSELAITRLDGTAVTCVFDHCIVYDDDLSAYVMVYKDGNYNYCSVATSANISGPYVNIAENVFHMPGAEAGWITQTANGNYIYAQNDRNYIDGFANYLISTNDFTKYGPNPFPRLTIDDRIWIRNLSPIAISERILASHIQGYSSDGIQTGSNKKPNLAVKSSRTNVYNSTLARFSVVDGMQISVVPNGNSIDIDYFWPVTSFKVVNYQASSPVTTPTLFTQSVNIYNDDAVKASCDLKYFDFAAVPYELFLSSTQDASRIDAVCTLPSRITKTYTINELSSTSSCILFTADMGSVLLLININSAVEANAYVDFVGFPSTNASFVQAQNNNGVASGLLAIGGRGGHMILAMTACTTSHAHAMIMI